MNIDYNLFWTLNPRKLKPFRKAREDRLKISQSRMNLQAWMMGLYVQRAIGSCFSNKAGSKYPEKPLEAFDPKDEIEQKKLSVDEEAEMFAQYVKQCQFARKMRDSAKQH